MTGPLPTPQLEILVDSPAHFRIGLLGNVVMVGWRGPMGDAATRNSARSRTSCKGGRVQCATLTST